MIRLSKEEEFEFYKLYRSTQSRSLPNDLANVAHEIWRENQCEKFKNECEKRLNNLIPFLRAAGYKRFWVGKNPYMSDANSGMLIATPECDDNHWPAIWDIVATYFPTSCGSRLEGADYIHLDVYLPEEFVKEYTL